MKTILILCLAVFTNWGAANLAWAQKPIVRKWQIKDESLAKLSHQTPEKTWESSLETTYSMGSAKYKASGSSLGDLSYTTYNLAAALAYGVTPDINIGFTGAYSSAQYKFENFRPPNENYSFKSQGLTDPSLGVYWRFYHVPDVSQLGASVVFTPSTGKAKSGTKSEDGNSLRGGEVLKLTLSWVYAWTRDAEIQLGVVRTQMFQAKYDDGMQDDPYGTTGLLGRFLYNVNPGIYLGGSLGITLAEAYSSKYSSGSKSDTESKTITALSFDTAFDINRSNSLKASLATTLPYSYKSGSLDISRDQMLDLIGAWIHQF